ncbi:AP-3 complex subunit beta-2 isoform X1 [Cydia strobilella]
MAFTEVCPERMSLIHRSYRKICSLLADVDEWGQLTLLNVLTVYAKTFFPDPNDEQYSTDSDEPFYESDSETDGAPKKRPQRAAPLDPDHRLLLRAAKPLLQSRNSGVVMAVAQLFYHAGPAQELAPVAKAMIRLLRAPVEVQSVVLNSIAALTVNKRTLFEPFLKSFFVRNSDPTHLKLLKLEILTNLATETSAAVVLREFQTYVTCSDKVFAGATIQAIGRLAVAIQGEAETCLNGLLKLLSSKDEWVVCEAVVVVKRVVGGGATSARAAVARAAKLLRSDRLAPNARAAAVWLVAEHGAEHPRAAAILAHMASNFADQDELVKLQLLSLAVKLSITQPDTLPVCRYVMTLAHYDASYDVRDRARMLRRFILQDSELSKHKAEIFHVHKPKPPSQSNFKDREQFIFGSLSQYIGTTAAGYRPLPTAPETAQGARLRAEPTQEIESPPNKHVSILSQKDKTFYSEPESSGSGSSSSEESSSEESSDEEDANDVDKKVEKAKEANNYNSNSGTSDTDSDSDSSSSDEESESDSSAESSEHSTEVKEKVPEKSESKPKPEPKSNEKSNLELLLELDEVASSLPTMTPTCGGFLSPPSVGSGAYGDDAITPVPPAWTPTTTTEVISRVTSRGLAAARRWTRAPHLYSASMCAVEITFTNCTQEDIGNININKKTLTGSRSIHDFASIAGLAPGASASTTLGVDFQDSIQPVEFTVLSSLGEVLVSITPPVGELMRAVTMSEARWDTEQKRLRGMTECDKKAAKPADGAAICKRVFETANVAAITAEGDLLRFAGRMMSSQDLVLLSVNIASDSTRVTANCPNMAIASLLANQVAQAFNT